MNIVQNFDIVMAKSGEVITISNGVRFVETPGTDRFSTAVDLYNACWGGTETQRTNAYDEFVKAGRMACFSADGSTTATPPCSRDRIKMAVSQMLDFFKEFNFTPNFRFLNTLAHHLATGTDAGVTYIMNYFELMDSPFINEIVAKVSSREFKMILKDFSMANPTTTVNTRFKLYYGPAGCGKTTLAMQEAEDRAIVCNASMVPRDLMQDFGFNDGKAGFGKTLLRQCMENGQKIVLDEINLLPFESLRFLQGILDNKSEIDCYGETVHIADGFEVIGTMNLTVNGQTFGLPEPLVDRCADAKKFELTAEQLMGALE